MVSGDWLAPEETDIALICHAFYGYNAYIMSKMAAAIGDVKKAGEYKALYEELKAEFADTYFDSETRMEMKIFTITDTQLRYLPALLQLCSLRVRMILPWVVEGMNYIIWEADYHENTHNNNTGRRGG